MRLVHRSSIIQSQSIVISYRRFITKMSGDQGEGNIPQARLTGHMPGHIKARPGQFGKAAGLTRQQGEAAFFFEKEKFAVAGASTDESKFGYKILAWYHQHSLPVTPLNPKTPIINVDGTDYQAVASPSKLDNPELYGLSIVTPPHVTKALLKEAKEAGITAVWLQPGTFDDEILKSAAEDFQASLGGMEGGTQGGEGWCVLVDGEKALERAGRKWESRL